MNTNDDTLLTLKEVCDLCRICRTTLWKWENERGVQTVNIGGIKRIRRGQLDEFLKRYETRADKN